MIVENGNVISAGIESEICSLFKIPHPLFYAELFKLTRAQSLLFSNVIGSAIFKCHWKCSDLYDFGIVLDSLYHIKIGTTFFLYPSKKGMTVFWFLRLCHMFLPVCQQLP